MTAPQGHGFFYLLGLTLLATAGIAAAAPGSAGIADAQRIVDLSAETDAEVQAALEASLKALALDAAVRKGRLAVTLVDVTAPDAPRWRRSMAIA